MFEFSFFTDIEELEDGACLQFTVWDKDRLSADDFIGETLCELKCKRFVYFAQFWIGQSWALCPNSYIGVLIVTLVS